MKCSVCRICFYSSLFLLLYFILSLFISLSYMQVKEIPDSLDAELYDDILLDSNLSHQARREHLQKLYRKAKDAFKSLQKLRQSQDCQFECQPAKNRHWLEGGIGLLSSDSSTRIMIRHCLNCLRSKGYLEKIMARRDIASKMLATPFEQPTSPLSGSKTSISKNLLHQHNIFGGWISANFRSGRTDGSDSSNDDVLNYKSRKLFAATRKTYEVQTSNVVIGNQLDNDYVNNYPDVLDDVPHLENMEERTKNMISKGLFYLIVFVGLFFIILVPLFRLIEILLDDYKLYFRLCCEALTCRDMKYTLLRADCEKKGVFIPSYKEYKSLMEEYPKSYAEAEQDISVTDSETRLLISEI